IWDTAGVDVKGHQLTYVSGPCTCTQCLFKPPEEPPKHHGAQFQLPLSKECPGFEVLIQEIGDRHFIAIGVVCRNHNLHKFPGWRGNAAGYHVDDGRIYARDYPDIGKECKELDLCKVSLDKKRKRLLECKSHKHETIHNYVVLNKI
ncbi:SPRY domain-containing protein 3, partial [Exaiptasia diaphana]